MPDKDKGLDYKKAGVDIDAADETVKRMLPWINATRRPEVLSDIGGFAGFFKLDTERYPKPVLLSGTDGVGTKLKIAQMAGKHDTIGIDLVAMCVNDILVHGAEPLFFLDYLAVGKVDPERIEKIVIGVAEGCKQAGCALIGGETAEMPGFYAEDEYDMAGFAVGVANEDKIITGKTIEAGDVVIGLSSSGIHSNGYSLARKVLLERTGMKLDQKVDELGSTLVEELLRPTRIYVRSINKLLEEVEVKGLAHISGGGIDGNFIRVLPNGLQARIDQGAWEVPPIFNMMARLGDVAIPEMFRTFNMGIGFIVVVKSSEADKTVDLLKNIGEKAFVIGEIFSGERGVVIS
ncbi:MAG: phosphoribosylformylglycinamidine cyclo-ligase [Candidatus Saccharibacteria bacterium]